MVARLPQAPARLCHRIRHREDRTILETAGYSRARTALLAMAAAAAAGAPAVASAEPTRPCTDGDWSFAFGECDANQRRNVYAHPALGRGTSLQPVCDPELPGSRPIPAPIEGMSCRRSCPAGSRLGVAVDEPDGVDPSGASSLTARCELCPAGRFSLGGGILVSGAARSWRYAWPLNLQTTCSYYSDEEQAWKLGHERGPTCPLDVQSPASILGLYAMSAAPWNAGLPASSAPIIGVLRLASDATGCTPQDWPQPSAEQVVIMLARSRGCSLADKAAIAAQSGATAVIVVNTMQHSPLAISESRSGVGGGTVPNIPLLAIGRSDGDVFFAAAASEDVVVNISSPHCRVDEALMGSTWDGDYYDTRTGCEPWSASPTGRFAYSGDNKGRSTIYSELSLYLNLVKDGYVRFRYMVDAEEFYDGFRVELDEMVVLPLVSKQPTYTEHILNLSSGTHTVVFNFVKDETMSQGEDVARLELLEVVGTHYTDMECQSCGGISTNSRAGAASCNTCARDTYLTDGGSDFGSYACTMCPPGKWSPPGSVGEAACMPREPCTTADLETRYTRCENGQRSRREQWREPQICDDSPARTSVRPSDTVTPAPCAACQPNEHRPAGGECAPSAISCDPGLLPVQEYVVLYWEEWPRNFTREVWMVDQSDPTVDQPDADHHDGYGWRLHAEGAFAFVGDDSLREVDAWTHDMSQDSVLLSQRHGDAKLHLNVDLTMPGEVSFSCILMPADAWDRNARFLVDGVAKARSTVAVSPVAASGGAASLLRVSVPLPSGPSQLTWVWEYSDDGDDESDGGAAHAGIQLLNVSVLHASGAGASRCRRCPPGHGVAEGDNRCTSCPRGTAPDGNTFRCAPCPPGTFASQVASVACQPCGDGTRSSEGAFACEPLAMLVAQSSIPGSAPSADALPVAFNVSFMLDAWRRAAGSAGPFSVAGRLFHVGVVHPVEAAAADPSDTETDAPAAFVWEHVPLNLLGSGRCAAASGDDSSPSQELYNWGASFLSASPVTATNRRGVKFSYGDGEACSDGRRSSASIVFVCDPHGADPPPVARQDAQGVFHMPNLRHSRDPTDLVTESSASSSNGSSTTSCAHVVLEWSTRTACPPCRVADYVPELGECVDNERDVSYRRARPCFGGQPGPPPETQPCGDTETQELLEAHPAVWVVVALGLGSSCCLCCYAGYLHRKYGQYARLE